MSDAGQAMDGSAPVAVPMPLAATSSRPADFLALTKPRLNFLVVATAMAGYYMGSTRFDAAALANTVVGTALVAGGASAFNQVVERDVDAMMRRTRLRPLPDGRLRASAAAWFALVLSVAGVCELALGANVLAAAVALTTLLTYLLVYTPLKKRTSLATLIGGVPGALPAVIGWAAARGRLSIEAWALFGIVFLWQMPHFLSIGWMCREDYARAGLLILPVVEPDGRSTAAQAVIYLAALVPMSLVPTLIGLTGGAYFVGAALLGTALLTLGVRFARHRSHATARALFLASITYLPLLWGLLLANRVGN